MCVCVVHSSFLVFVTLACQMKGNDSSRQTITSVPENTQDLALTYSQNPLGERHKSKLPMTEEKGP